MKNCAVCNAPVGSAYARNEWKESICVAHAGLPGCLWCGSHRALQEQNGIFACQPCRDTETDSNEKVARCVEDVLRWYQMVIGPHRLDDVSVSYGGLTVPPPGGGTLGWTNAQWRGNAGHAEILTVPFVPEAALHQILAHEFAHVVLILEPSTFRPHGRIPSDELIVEGSCEVFAHEYLLHRGDDMSTRLAERIERNPHPVYGDGYRGSSRDLQRLGGLADLLAERTGWVKPSNLTGSGANGPAMPPVAPVRPRNIVVPRPDERVTREHRPVIEMKPAQPAARPAPSPDATRPVIRMKPPR